MAIKPRTCTVDLKPPVYPPAAQGFLRMDANTSLMGPNPAIERALKRGFDLSQYPSGYSDDLRSAIARRHGVSVEQVVVGDGSDEILDGIGKAFLDPGDTVVAPSPSFVMYAFYGKINFGSVVEIPLLDCFQLDVDAILAARAKVTFLASPNNPTGNAWSVTDIERVIRGSSGLVVVDEAYADFCGQDFCARVRDFENVVVTRTFSKSYGLAGLRVGYCIGPQAIVERLMAVKTPFTVGTLAELIALEALSDSTYVSESVRIVGGERAWLSDQLAKLGMTAHPSDANFMLVSCGRPSRDIVRGLRDRKILVRDMSDFRGLAECFRMTIGRREHNQELLTALTLVLK